MKITIPEGYPDIISDYVKSFLEKEHEIDVLLSEKNNISALLSATYKRFVDDFVRVYQIELDDVPNKINDLSEAISIHFEIIEKEKEHKEKLEQLAKEVHFSLKEFEFIKEMVDDEIMKLSLSINKPDSEGIVNDFDIEQELEEQEMMEDLLMTVDFEKYQEIVSNKFRRELVKFLNQGNAILKMKMFYLVKDKLDEIDPELVPLYKKYIAFGNLRMFKFKYVSISGLVGKSSVDENGVDAQGVNFPILIHEITKGIYNYLGDVGTDEQLALETADDELLHMLAGPELMLKFINLIPDSKQHYIPVIFKILVKDTDEEDIKSFFDGNEDVVEEILDKAVEMMNR